MNAVVDPKSLGAKSNASALEGEIGVNTRIWLVFSWLEVVASLAEPWFIGSWSAATR
jgi:hypothetical protein